MSTWLEALSWRSHVAIRAKTQRAIELLRDQGLQGLVRALWYKWRHPLRCGAVPQHRYKLLGNVQGNVLLVDAADTGIGRELALYAVHEPITTRLIAGFVCPGECVIDLGANIGYYCLMLARLVGPQGKVLAIEPHPHNFHVLQTNLLLNRVANVECLQAAVSDRSGVATLYVSSASNWHTLNPTRAQDSLQVEVPTITLDELTERLPHPPQLIRMDTEGFEARILDGGRRLLGTQKPRLIIEVHPAYLGQKYGPAMLRQLLDWGYECRFVVLRADDRPWQRKRHQVREIPLRILADEPTLFRTREAFTVFLEKATPKSN